MTSKSSHAFCTLAPVAEAPTPSIVVMARWPMDPTANRQERTGAPSTCTVQAPHCAMPQPNLVPVNPSRSLSTQRRGMSGGASISLTSPLICRLTMSTSSRSYSGSGVARCHKITASIAGFQTPVQKLLHLLKQLHAVLFQHDVVGAFADLYIALIGCMGEPGEVGVQHGAGRVCIPLGVRQEGGYTNLRRVVLCLAGGPELAYVLHDAVGRTHHRRCLLRTLRIAGRSGVPPGVEPSGRDQFRRLVFGHALQPASLRSFPRDAAVGAQLPARVDGGRRSRNPD